jgi:hypothetical protein
MATSSEDMFILGAGGADFLISLSKQYRSFALLIEAVSLFFMLNNRNMIFLLAAGNHQRWPK